MQKTANIEELKSKKISRLLWQYALPAIVGTTVNALYNVIDRFFIGHGPNLGKAAMTSIGIALPIMIVITAVGMLIGAGSASRISIYMGKGDKNTAEKILGNALLLSVVLSTIAIAILLIFLDPLLTLVGATDQTFAFAKEFLTYYLPGSIFSTMCFGFNNMMRASGYPFKAMYTMLISVFANLLLAPLFIFVFKWGIKGAALATVLAMFIGLCFVMHHFMNKNSTLRLRWSNVKFESAIVKSIISIGLSPFFIQLASASVTLVFVHQLKQYGSDDAVGAFTIANTLTMLIVMIIIGLTQGMQPIVGFNYGNGNINRVKETLIYTIKIGVIIGTIGLSIGLLFPQILARFFTSDIPLINETVKALRIITIMLPLVGFQIVVTNFFQSIGMAGKSILLSLSRQFLILLPALFILPPIYGLNGVWSSMPVSDFLATVLTAILFIQQIHIFKKSPQNDMLNS